MTDTIDKRTPSAAEAIGYVARKEIAKVRTRVPGVIQAYDASEQSCEVKVGIKRRLEDGTFFEDPVLVNVPVMFPQGGGFCMHFPLESGDPVMVEFCERSVDEWLLASSVITNAEPSDPRRFDVSDATVTAGLSIFADPMPAAMAKTDAITIGVRSGDTRVEIKSSGAIDIISDGGTQISMALDGSITLTSTSFANLGGAAASLLAKAAETMTNFTNIAAIINEFASLYAIALAAANTAGSAVPIVVEPGGITVPAYTPTPVTTTKARGV